MIRLACRDGQWGRQADAQWVRLADAVCLPGEDERADLKGGYWWVAEQDGERVAYAAMHVWAPDNAGFLSRAGVIPDARGQGLQKALARARLRYARRLGLEAALTYVAPHNVASLNSLVAVGGRFYTPAWRWAGVEMLYLWWCL